MTRKRGKKAKTPRQPAMRITKTRREQIERLPTALAAIAPSTSPGSGFCVQKVAEQMRLVDYWKKQRNKKEDIAYLLENVFRKYPRKPKTLVLETVKGGVQWMARMGKQVTQKHVDTIADTILYISDSRMRTLYTWGMEFAGYVSVQRESCQGKSGSDFGDQRPSTRWRLRQRSPHSHRKLQHPPFF